MIEWFDFFRSLADRRANLDQLRKQLEPEDYRHHGIGIGGAATLDLMSPVRFILKSHFQ